VLLGKLAFSRIYSKELEQYKLFMRSSLFLKPQAFVRLSVCVVGEPGYGGNPGYRHRSQLAQLHIMTHRQEHISLRHPSPSILYCWLPRQIQQIRREIHLRLENPVKNPHWEVGRVCVCEERRAGGGEEVTERKRVAAR